ncbi:MAG TPA: hypothetical protein EYO93_02745 [Nitrososphaerales archaeon]|nr:hypothetical protein [Nitrososphaerales archaeon]
MKPLIVIISILIFIAGLQISNVFVDIPEAHASSHIESVLTSEIVINELGVVVINYNLKLSNSGQTEESLDNDIVLHLPLEFKNKIDGYRINSSTTNSELIISSNWKNTLLSVKTNGEFKISPNKEFYVNIELILTDILKSTERPGLYFAEVPIITTSNIHIDKEILEIRVPNSAPFYNISDYTIKGNAFSRSQQMNWEVARAEFLNVTSNDYRDENVLVLANPGIKAFSIIKVDSFLREIYISKQGDVMIRERIEIRNAENGMELHQIGLDLLGPERDDLNVPIIRSVTSVSDREPVLIDTKIIILENTPANRLDLKKLTRYVFATNTTLILNYEYRLNEELINVNANSISVDIPTERTLNTIAKEYKIVIIESNSFQISTESPMELNLSPNEQLENMNITLSYTPKLAWASNQSFPVGSIIFVLALLGMMTQVEKKKEEGIEVEDEIDVKIQELAAFYGERMSLLRNILERIERIDKEDIRKNQIENVKNEVNTIRTRNSAELVTLRKDIISLRPSQRELFSSLNKKEQLLERDIFQIIQLYEQYRLNRININDMEDKLGEYRKNVLKKIDGIIAIIQANMDVLKQK